MIDFLGVNDCDHVIRILRVATDLLAQELPRYFTFDITQSLENKEAATSLDSERYFPGFQRVCKHSVFQNRITFYGKRRDIDRILDAFIKRTSRIPDAIFDLFMADRIGYFMDWIRLDSQHQAYFYDSTIESALEFASVLAGVKKEIAPMGVGLITQQVCFVGEPIRH